MEEAVMDKNILRREAAGRRNALSAEERVRASILLTERIAGHQWFYRAKYFLGFVSYGSEIDTHPLLEEALRLKKQVYVPRVESAQESMQGYMRFYHIYSMDDLQPGYRGIPEPKGDTEAFDYAGCLRDGEIDRALMLMPGLVFDPYRNRVGYGKGYYDRYLNEHVELQQHTIAVGFRCQMVERIPADPYDIRPCQVICM